MFWPLHESSFHRIPVHVTKALHLLARAPYIKVIEAPLPHQFPHSLPQHSLIDRSLFSLAVQDAGLALGVLF